MIRISIDAMGGDHGPETIIPGLAKVAERRPDARFVIFGQEDRVRPVLDARPLVRERSDFHHCDVAVGMDDKPSQALRRGRWKSSMWRATEAVKNGEADVCVSAGNTGALMAMSKFCLRTMAHIERPAIAAIWPTIRGESVVLDVGANVDCEPHHLEQFAIMGDIYSRSVFGIRRPRVGLLSIGEEDTKGNELTKEAFNALLKTLEEPPAHVKFMFATTEPEKVLPTILSRCQRFDFPPIETGQIVERLVRIVQQEGVEADLAFEERVFAAGLVEELLQDEGEDDADDGAEDEHWAGLWPSARRKADAGREPKDGQSDGKQCGNGVGRIRFRGPRPDGQQGSRYEVEGEQPRNDRHRRSIQERDRRTGERHRDHRVHEEHPHPAMNCCSLRRVERDIPEHQGQDASQDMCRQKNRNKPTKRARQ